MRVSSDAGKHGRVFEVGETLLDIHARGGSPPLDAARVHLTIAQAAVAGARLAEAGQHTEQARQVDVTGVLAARIGALGAHVAIDERRAEDAGRLARGALATAERSGEIDVACEALFVLGRLARAGDLDRAEEISAAHTRWPSSTR